MKIIFVDLRVAETAFYRLNIAHVLDFHYRKLFMPNIKSDGGSGGNGQCHKTWQEAYDEGIDLMSQWQQELDDESARWQEAYNESEQQCQQQ